MKKLYLSIIIFGLFLFSSCYKTYFCNVKDPIHDLPWLEEIIIHGDGGPIEPFNGSIYKAVFFNTQTKMRKRGFIISSGEPMTYYDCSGKVMGSTGGVDPIPCDYKVIKSDVIYENLFLPQTR